ncbi:MAG: glycosyltransferase family 4 protein [Ginsengibacter sp.]
MKICFWGNINSALNGETHGGGELQLALLAKALANAGHEVVIIDFTVPEDLITSDGIKVYKIKGWNNGIPIIRTFTHRLPKLYNSLKDQKADVYYCRMRDFRHIFAYWAARKVKAKFVMGLASNLDVSTFFKRFKYQYVTSPKNLWNISSSILIEIIQPMLLKNADAILVQHETQRMDLLKKNIVSKVLPNLFDGCKAINSSFKASTDFIHIGRLDKRKGFIDFFKLIEKTPFYNYKIVGLPSNRATFSYYNRLKEFKNVKLLGRLKHSEVIEEIANSKALISTSPMEGFPNVFIEAWACGIPVLSLYFDPGIIEQQKLGKVANGSMEILINEMGKMTKSEEFSKKAKQYVQNNHLLNKSKIEEIDSLFTEILDSQ